MPSACRRPRAVAAAGSEFVRFGPTAELRATEAATKNMQRLQGAA